MIGYIQNEQKFVMSEYNKFTIAKSLSINTGDLHLLLATLATYLLFNLTQLSGKLK